MFVDPNLRAAHNAAVEDDHVHFMKRGDVTDGERAASPKFRMVVALCCVITVCEHRQACRSCT